MLGPWTYDQDPFISKWEALGTLALAFAGLGVLRWLAGKYNAPSQKPTVRPDRDWGGERGREEGAGVGKGGERGRGRRQGAGWGAGAVVGFCHSPLCVNLAAHLLLLTASSMQATRVLPFNNLEAELGGVPASA